MAKTGQSKIAWQRRFMVLRQYCIYGERSNEIAEKAGVNMDTIRMDLIELRRRYGVKTNAQLCYEYGRLRKSLGYR